MTDRGLWFNEECWPAYVEDAFHHKAMHDAGIPATDVADQGRRLAGKFKALVEPVLDEEKAARLIDEIGGLEDLPEVRSTLAVCGG